MKKILLCLSALAASVSFAQTPCVGGMAGGFECKGYDLKSQIPLSTMNSVKANDSWGWTDPQDGKEYAIICLNEATAFIDISDPVSPVYLGQLPGESTIHSTWRDAKTYNNHVFIVSEDSGHGMQIFDLTRLRNVANPPEIFTPDFVYNGFGSAHNIVINEATGYAYGVGTSTFSGGPHFINIQDPVNPVAEGGYATDGYTHDAMVVIYNGPDTDYTGDEIFFGSNENEVVIINVTDKANPQLIATIDYNNVSYTHQGWLTEDHRYFLLGDETDEINLGFNSRTIIFDFEDLDDPQFHFEYTGPTGATDHNGYVKDDKFYLANNAAGLRVVDIADIANENMSEVGFFDSYSMNNNAGFNGSWNIYPFFESGHIVISDRAEGMLLVKAPELGVADFTNDESFAIYPNPANTTLNIVSKNVEIKSVRITNILGSIVYSEIQNAAESTIINISGYANGMYFVTINDSVTRKIIKE
ncbi:MAG: choice-of-anchor B family protein [Flavobacteriaceae bacterium]|nr:choice-of-anchor B family protein [Flavobacteriaceae bacterium]